MKINFNKWKQNKHIRHWIFTSLLIICSSFSTSLSQQLLQGNVPAAIKNLGLKSIGRLDSNTNLHFVISLPLRNKEGLTLLLKQIYDPSSPNYHHYLTPDQFTEQFGPSENDYQSVVNFTKQNALNVIGTSSDRLLLNVDGQVADVEKTFHVKLLKYQHPNESRTFFSPDVEPSIQFGLNILEIVGLNNYSLAYPLSKNMSEVEESKALSGTGSGAGGTFRGNDFRAAYVPGVSEDGTGQIVSILGFYGYQPKDISDYEDSAFPGKPHVYINNIYGIPEIAHTNNLQQEVCMDIELPIAMAPSLSEIRAYLKKDNTIDNYVTILNDMTNTIPLALQLSSSWHIDNQGTNSSAEQSFLKMQAQGQSFFRASGDNGAYSNMIPFPTDDTNITVVGGTTLTMQDGKWYSETVWNNGDGQRSGGGISTQIGLPFWQNGVINTENSGSTTMRNFPDVALTADNIDVRSQGTNWTKGGTSAAAPLWAGYTALINQRAAENSQPPIGFLNPLLYSIGKGSTYNSDFHDITSGNNNGFNAVSGYDLCTGWGTPDTNLLGDLVPNKIHVDQKLSTGNKVGTIGKWNGNSFSPRLNPGDSISISPGSTIVFQGDQNIYSREKYNIWKRNLDFESNVSNHHSFLIGNYDHNFTSNFQPMNNATIQSQLLENGSIGGSLKFQDPWLIDFQELGYGANLRNQGMTAPFNTVTYSSDNLGTNTSHSGIFLNQLITQKSYYSIQAPLTQSINGHTGAFQNWDSPNATFQQVGSNPSGYDQKAVVFNNAGAIVTAKYKGIHLSNNSNAFSNNSQRKVVRTGDGTIHLVYESMGHVWYEISTDNGTSWDINNNGHPLDSGAGKLPSIDYYGNMIAIVFQQQNGNNYNIKAQVYYNYSGKYILGVDSIIHNEVYDLYSVNANPNISWGYNSKFVVTFERIQNGEFPPMNGINYISGSMNYTNITINSKALFPGTNNSSINSTISTNKEYEYPAKFHVAWEQNNTVKYCALLIDASNNVTFSSVDVPSSGNTFSYNNNPQIAVDYLGDAYLTWIGSNNPGNGSSKIVNRANNGGSWSSTFNYYGNNVASPTLHFANSSAQYIIAWSEGDGSSNKFYRSDFTARVLDYNNSSRSIQVINGNSLDGMYSISFNNSSLPYYFHMTRASVIPKTLSLTAIIEGFYHIGSYMASDTVTVELHNQTSPYALIESQKGVLDCYGVGTFDFITAANGISYYIVVKHRNSIETWSAAPHLFSFGSLLYDFTTSQSQAYGSNLVQKGSKWCIYSGDVNQDGVVDSGDLGIVDDAVSNYITGYVNSDVNGDYLVDSEDTGIVDNNNSLYIAKVVPTNAPAVKQTKDQFQLVDKNQL